MKTGYLVMKKTDNMEHYEYYYYLDEPLICFTERKDAVGFIKNYDNLRDQEFVVGYSSQDVDNFTEEEMRITDIEKDEYDEKTETRIVVGNVIRYGEKILSGTRILLHIVEIPCA